MGPLCWPHKNGQHCSCPLCQVSTTLSPEEGLLHTAVLILGPHCCPPSFFKREDPILFRSWPKLSLTSESLAVWETNETFPKGWLVWERRKSASQLFLGGAVGNTQGPSLLIGLTHMPRTAKVSLCFPNQTPSRHLFKACL